jgi:hypothetical protein|tara:strand:- start:585 stop:1862 length:1278 start_codon:yes stop_codon:yes gene_type:complete
MEFSRKIKLNGYDIHEEGIVLKMLVIKDWFFDMVPRVEITLTDSKDVLYNLFPIQDDGIIEFEINKNVQEDKKKNPLIVTFNILDWESSPIIIGTNEGHNHAITGYMNVFDLFHPNVTKSFKEKTSGDVVKDIANTLGITYTKKFKDETSDKMNWLQIGQNNHDMLKYVNERSYITDDDTTLIYVNIEGELVYTTLKTECEKEVSFVGQMDQEKQADNSQTNFDDETLGTGENKDKPVFYFSSTFNKTLGSHNKMATYASKSTYYDGTLEAFDFPGIGNGDKLLNSLSQRNLNNVNHEVTHFEFGILNGGDNFTEGVHNEFFHSQVRHEYTMLNFFKNSLTLKIKGNNLIKKYDVVDIIIKEPLTNEINEVHSGKYLVGGVIHTLGDDVKFETTLFLYRSGINKPSLDAENLLLDAKRLDGQADR